MTVRINGIEEPEKIVSFADARSGMPDRRVMEDAQQRLATWMKGRAQSGVTMRQKINAEIRARRATK